MKKTIYFHIGTHKTGTTALQNFFIDNKDYLKSQGFLYENYNNKEMNQGYLAFKPELWDSIELNPKFNHIISGEDFYSNIITQYKIIKNKISNFKINFIVYFKRQDLMLQSVYNQLVKMHGYTKKDISEDIYNLDYYTFLHDLKKNYPDAEITIRIYEKKQWYKETIYSDFLNILGLELNNKYKLEKKIINPSLATEKMEFIRNINLLNLPIEFRTKLSILIIKVSLESGDVSLFRKQNLISPEDSKNLLTKYNDGNEAIAKEFLGREDGKLFYEEIIEDKNWKPYPGLNETVAKEIFEKIKKIDNNILSELLNLILAKKDVTVDFRNVANFLTPILLDVLEKNNKFTLFSTKNEASTFSTIREKLDEKSDSADILREVALAFEESNDIVTAYKIMEEAKMLRPNGPFINQKLQEYLKRLEESF